jgi:hypothetical protein
MEHLVNEGEGIYDGTLQPLKGNADHLVKKLMDNE